MEEKDAEIKALLRAGACTETERIMLSRLHSCFVGTKSNYVPIKAAVDHVCDVDLDSREAVMGLSERIYSLAGQAERLKMFRDRVFKRFGDATYVKSEAMKSKKALEEAREHVRALIAS